MWLVHFPCHLLNEVGAASCRNHFAHGEGVMLRGGNAITYGVFPLSAWGIFPQSKSIVSPDFTENQ